MYKLNRRIPNGTYGGVRGEKFIKNYPLLDYVIITKAIIKTKEMIARAIFVINDKINNCNNASSNICITSLSL